MIIDTHSHIYANEFNGEHDDVVQRALDQDVSKIVLPNIDSSSVKPMMSLSKKFPNVCYPLIGLHPTSVKEDYKKELEIMEYWLKKSKFYGIGEVGVDLYWDNSFLEEQLNAFRIQLRWAKEYKIPVVIHVRDSFDETFKVVEEEMTDDLTGVFHSFTGTLEQAEHIKDWGFKMGVNGIVTFKNAGVAEVVQKIGIEHLILETDAPYLAPVPNRGKRNESSFISHVADKISLLYAVPYEEVCKITTASAKQLFKF